MSRATFEGWYFKHQRDNQMIALIPGRSESGAFVQAILPGGSRFFPMPFLSVSDGSIQTGNCRFSVRGCHIDLPGISGKITYGNPTPLRSDIMGPFRFFPMECRHGIISMAHTLKGYLTVDNVPLIFDGGRGYCEKDSGTSFPVSYQWLQCNTFPEPCALMVSVARIPFGGLRFTGCIGAVIYRGREYRLATYNGVHILAAEETYLSLAQRHIQLTIEIAPSSQGHPLKSPVSGCMTGTIRERTNAGIHVRMWDHNRKIIDLRSPFATCEYVAEKP